VSEIEFPTAQEFCTELPMYKYYPVREKNFKAFLNFAQWQKTIDTYCIECEAMSTFKVVDNIYARNNIKFDSWHEYFPFHTIRTRCSRDDRHEAQYYFKFDSQKGAQKIGQYPSVADASRPGLAKYRSVLTTEDHKGLVKSVGLFSHSVGAGSLIYLRKIFETLINEAYTDASKSEKWKELHATTFKRSSVSKKIKALEDHLPTHLVKIHKMYSVLSAGVHSMSEAECLELFPLMNIGIELILNQKLRQKEEELKLAELQRMLNHMITK
jgi:hypothetical protein